MDSIVVDGPKFFAVAHQVHPRGVERKRYTWIDGVELQVDGARYTTPDTPFEHFMKSAPRECLLCVDHIDGRNSIVFICKNRETRDNLAEAIKTVLGG